jgi:kynurenine formamidase
MTLIELSHVIRAGTVTYPGLPAPEITPHPWRAPFAIARIAMVGNTGTYVDSPAHRHKGGDDVAAVPLDRLVDVPGLVVRVGGGVTAIDRSHFATYDVAGCAVLVHTGWDRHFGTDEYGAGGHPYLTANAVDWLVTHDAAVVGIDSVNIDGTSTGERPAHTGLLGAGIPIVEHLTGLAELPRSGFRFHAVPPRIAGMTSFPVRAYAVL